MATITYTFVDRCAGGGHTRLDVSVNGGAAQRIVYDTDDIRSPLSNLTQDQQDTLKLLILKVHMNGKTRAQIVTEFASPVTVTI
jgi:hypothetical protein